MKTLIVVVTYLSLLHECFSTFPTLKTPPLSNGGVMRLQDLMPEDPKTYDKMRPPRMNDEPTTVSFHVTVMGIDSINENSMTYAADIFFAQTWSDYRLRLPENMTTEYRLLEVEWLNNMWRPDSYFKNAKAVTFQTMTIPNHYIWIYQDKKFLYMVKLTLTLSCAMNYAVYPHDTQECRLQMESLSHTTDDLVFKWDDVDIPLVVDDNIELPQFDLVENRTDDCTEVYSTGNFTCLEVVFVLRRRLGYYLFHTYMPTCLIVIMSWVSFWIKPEAAPARVTLGVTSLLTLSTQHAKSQASLPPVSYIKIIDMFMSTCTIFVFLALMEYALVNIVLGDGPDISIPSKATSENDPPNESLRKVSKTGIVLASLLGEQDTLMITDAEPGNSLSSTQPRPENQSHPNYENYKPHEEGHTSSKGKNLNTEKRSNLHDIHAEHNMCHTSSHSTIAERYSNIQISQDRLNKSQDPLISDENTMLNQESYSNYPLIQYNPSLQCGIVKQGNCSYLNTLVCDPLGCSGMKGIDLGSKSQNKYSTKSRCPDYQEEEYYHEKNYRKGISKIKNCEHDSCRRRHPSNGSRPKSEYKLNQRKVKQKHTRNKSMVSIQPIKSEREDFLPAVPPPPPPPQLTPKHPSKKKIKEAQKRRARAIMVDRFSRVFFPLTFGVMNAVYWIIFALYLNY